MSELIVQKFSQKPVWDIVKRPELIVLLAVVTAKAEA